jgi:neopullulanase
MKNILFLYIFISAVVVNEAFSSDNITIKHVEPAFWWVNMNNPKLQVLVHGKDIGLTTPDFSYPGVSIDSVVRTENKNYLFIYIHVSKQSLAGKFPIHFRIKNKEVAKYIYELKERRNGSSERESFSSADVVYLLMPDRFANGDTTNDSSSDTYEKAKRSDSNGRHGGDIQGIIDHIGYLDKLGITTIWSTPLVEDNMSTYSYHTYAITDYYKIDSRYGTNQDYCRLSDEVHKHKMKLIMDMVTNHCGSNHWWMNDLPSQEWVHQFKEFTRSNYHISTTYDPYASEYDKNLNFNGWFDNSMPDLNQDNPHLLIYLIQNAIWWVEYANLDGIRVDTYPYNSPWKAAQWSKAIRSEYPKINIVGECWVHSQQEIAYWQSGTKNFDGYDSNLPTVMDFPLHDQFLTAFNEDDSWLSGINRFYNHFTLDFAYTHPMNLMVYTENHDTRRFIEVIKGDIRKYKIAYALLLTIRGIPQIYYGAEILLPGDKNKGDGDIRRDFPGGWARDSRDAFTSEGRTLAENEAYAYLSKLLNWRKNNPVIHTGKTMQFIIQDKCYIYFRYNQEKTVMVVINNNDCESCVLDTNRFAERIDGFKSGYDIISEKKITDLSRLEIPAKTAMIIELNK